MRENTSTQVGQMECRKWAMPDDGTQNPCKPNPHSRLPPSRHPEARHPKSVSSSPAAINQNPHSGPRDSPVLHLACRAHPYRKHKRPVPRSDQTASAARSATLLGPKGRQNRVAMGVSPWKSSLATARPWSSCPVWRLRLRTLRAGTTATRTDPAPDNDPVGRTLATILAR
jgi:hypothetical protein